MVRLGNAASVRVLRKIGMEFVRRIEIRGIPADLYLVQRTSYPSSEQPNQALGRRP